ncbi:MarR family transcriptional regulator [Pantoea sp. KXB25]|uniref:MarR family transcriptional regulator n=1 Tax=unclassified Pantoea TaxID=2630326 RepID=UPI003AB7FE46
MDNNHHQAGYPIGLLIHAVNSHKDKILEEYLIDKDISPSQLKVLMGIYKGLTTPAELIRHMGIDSGSLNRMLERMVRHKVVIRLPDPDDRRYVRLSLTDKGNQLCIDFERDGMVNLPMKITERLNTEEVRTLTSLLIKMLPEDVLNRYFPY